MGSNDRLTASRNDHAVGSAATGVGKDLRERHAALEPASEHQDRERDRVAHLVLRVVPQEIVEGKVSELVRSVDVVRTVDGERLLSDKTLMSA